MTTAKRTSAPEPSTQPTMPPTMPMNTDLYAEIQEYIRLQCDRDDPASTPELLARLAQLGAPQDPPARPGPASQPTPNQT